MRTNIPTSTAKFRNIGEINHHSDLAVLESKLKGREIGNGLTLGMEETGGTGEVSGSVIRLKEVLGR